MIYTIDEIKKIVPNLNMKNDEQIQFLLQSAEMQICAVLRLKDLSNFSEMPMQIKTACVWIIENALQSEKTAWMKSFKQGNISVDYGDEKHRKEVLEDNLKHFLAPLKKAKVWWS